MPADSALSAVSYPFFGSSEVAKRRRFPQFRNGDLPADSQCGALSISGQYPPWSRWRISDKPLLLTADSVPASGGISCRRTASTPAGAPARRWRPERHRHFSGLGNRRRSKSRRSRLPAIRPNFRRPPFRFPEHDRKIGSLSSESFRPAGHRPDNFALSDPVTADAATGGLRAIGAAAVEVEPVRIFRTLSEPRIVNLPLSEAKNRREHERSSGSPDS